MTTLGFPEAWAASRADWSPELAFFEEQEFGPVREMVKFVAETGASPRTPVPAGLALGALSRDELPQILELGESLFAEDDPDHLARFYWENPFFTPDSLYAVRSDHGRGQVVGAAIAVIDSRYADPSRLDAAMPCFRLGALGTERERHKRVNGMVSCLFADEAVGEALLAEAARRFEAGGLAHAAGQARSDRLDLVAFYDRFFRRQGSFPILSRSLAHQAS
jgi:hypothetical protein